MWLEASEDGITFLSTLKAFNHISSQTELISGLKTSFPWARDVGFFNTKTWRHVDPFHIVQCTGLIFVRYQQWLLALAIIDGFPDECFIITNSVIPLWYPLYRVVTSVLHCSAPSCGAQLEYFLNSANQLKPGFSLLHSAWTLYLSWHFSQCYNELLHIYFSSFERETGKLTQFCEKRWINWPPHAEKGYLT